MEQTPDFTAAESLKDSDDDDVEKSKDTKPTRGAERGKEKAKELGSIIAADQRTPDKGKVVEKSKSLFGQVIEQTGVVADKSELLAIDEATEQLSSDEQQVAEELAMEGEIHLHDAVEAIPEERDALIIEEALEIAAEHDESAKLAAEATPEITTTELSAPDDELAVEQHSDEAQEPSEIESEIASDEEELPEPPRVNPTQSAQPSSAGAGSRGGSSSGRGGTPPPSPVFSGPLVAPMPALPRRPQFGAPQTAPELLVNDPEHTQVAVDRRVEDAESVAFRRGRNRGLVAGLLLGGGIEHIRHRRRERRMERQFAEERKQQQKQVENMRWDQVREAESAKIREAATERQRNIEQTRSTVQTEKEQAVRSETSEQEKRVADEKHRAAMQAEKEAQQHETEHLDIAEGHHIEQSAWHNIEVDQQGHAVQESSIEYGHEYYKERSQETAPKHRQQFDEAAGEVALVAAALNESGTPRTGAQTGSDPSLVGPDAQRQPTNRRRDDSVIKKLTSPPTTPAGTVGWSIALLIIVVVFVLLVR